MLSVGHELSNYEYDESRILIFVFSNIFKYFPNIGQIGVLEKNGEKTFLLTVPKNENLEMAVKLTFIDRQRARIAPIESWGSQFSNCAKITRVRDV